MLSRTAAALLTISLISLLAPSGCSKSSHEAPLEVPPLDHRPGDAIQVALQAKQGDAAAQPGADQPPRAEQPRKIKYTAELKLIVTDFAKAEAGLLDAMKEGQAFVAHAEVNTSPLHTGVWRIRVPVNKFDSFRAALCNLGAVERNTVDSEDLTAQYYDLDAHVKNRQAERDAMRKLLEKTGDRDMKQFLEVKRELDTINDDIGRKESLLRLWTNLTDLTTVNLTVREKQKYLAEKLPALSETPTFGVRAATTFKHSWEAFVGLVQGIALLVIAAIPWLCLLGAFAAVLWLIVRTRRMPKLP